MVLTLAELLQVLLQTTLAASTAGYCVVANSLTMSGSCASVAGSLSMAGSSFVAALLVAFVDPISHCGVSLTWARPFGCPLLAYMVRPDRRPT